MTTLPQGYTHVGISSEERRDLLALDSWTFPDTIDLDKADDFPFGFPWDRARGVRDASGELVACHASYPYPRFGVPGGTVPAAGLTWVGVHPGHRRRGLLSGMIREHVARSLERGEAISALYAAEMAIYGRFGFGLAARDVHVKVPRGAALRDVPGADEVSVRFASVDVDVHEPLVTALHERVERPGWTPRAAVEQRRSFLWDPPERRQGGEPLRIAIAERGGEPVGYALLRRKLDWGPAGPTGGVKLREVVVADAAVARALWGVLLDLDLMATVEAGNLALDDPLLHLLVNPRAALPGLADNVWVRVLDVPAALSARRYQAPVDVVLEVADALLPANARRWRLVGGPDGAEVTPTEDAADLALDVRELGSAYLGGFSLEGLAAAGLVAERTPGAVRRAAVAFGWPVAAVSSAVW